MKGVRHTGPYLEGGERVEHETKAIVCDCNVFDHDYVYR
ncbi:hypothetical protein EMIT074MI3_10704 [Bacillus licheniformis]